MGGNHNLNIAPPPHVVLLATRLLFWSLTRRRRPSFPTRRSSDLPGRSSPATRPATGASSPRGAGRVGKRDRKSTRLNSSHRCISYAVFCLKKKRKLDPVWICTFLEVETKLGLQDQAKGYQLMAQL